MKIPPEYQVFDQPVTLSFADQDRLSPHLSNWNRLSDVLLLNPDLDTLRKMLVIELMNRKRKPILYRIAGAISTRSREILWGNIERARQ